MLTSKSLLLAQPNLSLALREGLETLNSVWFISLTDALRETVEYS